MAGVDGSEPTAILLEVIDYGRSTQKDVAAAYAFALQRGDVDWRVVNEAIVDRWSVRGLHNIKKMAWEGSYVR